MNEKIFDMKEARAQQIKQGITKEAFANLLFVSMWKSSHIFLIRSLTAQSPEFFWTAQFKQP